MKFELERFEFKQLIIFGLAREGLSTYRFLRRHFPENKIILIDDADLSSLNQDWQQIAGDPFASFTAPDAAEGLPLENAVVFKSPGIPPGNGFLKEAEKAGAKISSNTNLFFELAADLVKDGRTELVTIGVTGTKGKSTTAAAIEHVLSASGKDAVLAGNIGVPALDLLAEQPLPKIVVLELSSHQLLSSGLSPHFAVLQNITSEHLDYYKNFEEYSEAKFRITKFQTESDYLVYNPVFELPRNFAEKSRAQLLTFGAPDPEGKKVLAYADNDSIFYQDEAIVSLEELSIKGPHTVQNLLPSIVIAKQLGLSSENIRAALIGFKPLSHRLEVVAEKNGITFVDDSLATTPEAAMAAIESFPETDLILLAGGFERNQDFGKLAEFLLDQARVKALILFPTTGERLEQEIRRLTETPPFPIEHTQNMKNAMEKVQKYAATGSVVLLSPASASYNMFKNYEDRGNQFRAEAAKLISPETA